MDFKEWKEETRRQIGLVSQYFKPKEVQTLYDFIETAKEGE